MVTIGLGTSSAYPRRRIPAPPQNSTTFIKSQAPGSAPRIGRPTRGYRPSACRLRLPDLVRMVDGNVIARENAALFIQAAVYRVCEKITADSAVMQHGRAFS